MRRSVGTVAVVVCGLFLVGTQIGDAADPAQAELSGWQKLFRQQAAGYKFNIEGRESAEVKLADKPILQWSQPVRGGADGAVFLWTDEGRPVAIGTFFIWPRNDGLQGISHELHSLSQAPFVATWKSRTWTPPKNSLALTTLPDAPAPAGTPEQRLRQMRELAKQFQAESRDKEVRQWNLRLLPRPIHRYVLENKAASAAKQNEVLDGALFAFVEGTDMEIVLLLQARETADGPRWEFGCARMSDFRLKVTHGDATVWEVGPANFDEARAAYYCSTVEARKSAEEP